MKEPIDFSMSLVAFCYDGQQGYWYSGTCVVELSRSFLGFVGVMGSVNVCVRRHPDGFVSMLEVWTEMLVHLKEKRIVNPRDTMYIEYRKKGYELWIREQPSIQPFGAARVPYQTRIL
jgi:hypothetical protein